LPAIGGKNTQKVTTGILSKLLSKTLALTISWGGTVQKLSFKDLRLCQVVTSNSFYSFPLVKKLLIFKTVVSDAVKRNKVSQTATDQEIRGHVQNWFSNTRDLEGGKRNRSKNVILPQQATPNSTGSEEHA
jgi:hypothetical protein